MISIICAMVMAPSAATGTNGLERLLLIFLMKTQQTKAQRTKPSPAKRSIQQSTGQNFVNSKELSRTQSQQQEPPQKLAILARTYHFSTKTSDSSVKSLNERRSFDLTD